MPVISITVVLQAQPNDGAEAVQASAVSLVFEPLAAVHVAVGPALGAAAVAQAIEHLACIQRAIREQPDTVAVYAVTEGVRVRVRGASEGEGKRLDTAPTQLN